MSKTALGPVRWLVAALGVVCVAAPQAAAALPDPTTNSDRPIGLEDCDEPGEICECDVTRATTIDGTAGADTLDGTPGDDVIRGRGGNDTIRGRGGEDLIYGEDGNDKLVGGGGTDYVLGEAGDDWVIGDEGIFGSGNAILTAGRDCVRGGPGADHLVGDDYAHAGTASDGANDLLLGGDHDDVVVGDSRVDTGNSNAFGSGNDWLAGSQGDDKVIGDSRSANGTANGGGTDSVNTGPGGDLGVGDAFTTSGSAVLAAGKSGGDDGPVWAYNPGCSQDPEDPNSDCVDGGVHLQYSADTGYGDNYAVPGSGGTTTGGGADEIGGFTEADTLFGGPGNDELRGDTAQQSVRFGGIDHVGGNDVIHGGDGNDRMFGYWQPNDVCDGGPGAGDQADVSFGWPGASDRSCDTWNAEITFP
jgi:Ca2+-binding RTX toxin-like protein